MYFHWLYGNPGHRPCGTQFVTLGSALQNPNFVQALSFGKKLLEGKDLSDLLIESKEMRREIRSLLQQKRHEIGHSEFLSTGDTIFFPDERMLHGGLSHESTKKQLPNVEGTPGTRKLLLSYAACNDSSALDTLSYIHRQAKGQIALS